MADQAFQLGNGVTELVARVESSGFYRLLPGDVPWTCAEPEPAPYDGCPVCAALVKQRAEARFGRGSPAVWECDRELRNHPYRRADDHT
ncbi:hypothetical protein Y717_11930 [Streptomyces scopuliridis RB72]|uniref:Uncharacterized protein n=1 Tax=Streptomyces scopuliridis RB72 TaxID=1440053 RepID=A0A2T7SNI4_9ACTN|nr:hypothetical protein Y717_11930 [Streptomyces scopuliridis RB72]